MDDRTESLGFHDCPDEEQETSNGYDESFDCEEMADLVDRRIDESEGDKPEEEEPDKVLGASTAEIVVWEIVIAGRHGSEHQDEALTT